jgi:acetylglutamate kinase
MQIPLHRKIAKALSGEYDVQLVYSFEKRGVLMDVNDENSLIPRIDPSYYAELKEKQLIFAGMIPKLDNAFAALQNGVKRVIIGRAEELPELLAGRAGTIIGHD